MERTKENLDDEIRNSRWNFPSRREQKRMEYKGREERLRRRKKNVKASQIKENDEMHENKSKNE